MNNRALGVAVALVAAAFVGVAAAAVDPPPRIANAGKIIFCSDMTYPPEESRRRGKPVGSDIDIARAAARLMGVTASFRQVDFGRLIASVLRHDCDAIVSGMTDNAQRRKKLAFADYMRLGLSLMVKTGNPLHITSLPSLSNRRVALQTGTAEAAVLVRLNRTLSRRGRKPVIIESFRNDVRAAAALATGRADAYFSDDLGVLFRVGHSNRRFSVAAHGIAAAPIGIAVPKLDPLAPAMRRAVGALYANGEMKAILDKWHLGAFALAQRR